MPQKFEQASRRTAWNKGLKIRLNTGRTHFKKGQTSLRKGIVVSQITKDKIAKANKGKRISIKTEFKKGLIPWNKGLIGHPKMIGHKPSNTKPNSGSFKKGMTVWNKGKKMSKEMRKKISGKNSANWIDGLSRNSYPTEFNKILKLKIRIRDGFTCCLCRRTEREELEELNRVLSVNHIDFDKNNCKESNLNTLCLRCNVKINRDREYWTNYFTIYE